MIALFYFAVRTRNVDLTISNILGGAVTYVPQTDSVQSASPVNTLAQESKNIPSTSSNAHTTASTVQVMYRQAFYCLVLNFCCSVQCYMRCETWKVVCTMLKSLT
jgi:hypothetical protein